MKLNYSENISMNKNMIVRHSYWVCSIRILCHRKLSVNEQHLGDREQLPSLMVFLPMSFGYLLQHHQREATL